MTSRSLKRLASILISLVILGIIYWRIDFPALLQALQNSSRVWMTISLAMVVPLTLLTAWRFQGLVPTGTALSFAESNRLILVACVLNLVLPSKMGDIAKAYFISQQGMARGELALALVVFEKTCDLLSLLVWGAFGLLLYPQKDWLFWLMTAGIILGLGLGSLILSSRRFAQILFEGGRGIAPKTLRPRLLKLQRAWSEMHQFFWQNKPHLLKIAALSVLIWFLHLLQIWLFILALKAWTPFVANLALAPLAILAGLLPLTFGGIGVRDAALIYFYRPFLSPAIAAALGLLCTARYVLPAIGGLPFLGEYLGTLRRLQKHPRQL